ncbi:putative membrane protein YecN with MAPEG domain [Salirhabdus euzebyi]|uniref:Putative membrane protein YecN with MAPEG domain n=1 Tax=Salirhabdus euzebyi TaxID=394506 RepID=A0A841Q200_9BACI|nr:hypothetical protein [Salirhabdus euzebyi]MBB6452055.1 putative membrane protein YecN with MAPEG domain [Salirhabdus euzebyi]
MNPGWLFVLASLIAVVGITISFRQLITRLEDKLRDSEEVNQKTFQKDLSRLFIKIMIIESIPIILIFLGFIEMNYFELTNLFQVYIPLILVLGILVFGLISIFSTRGAVIAMHEIPKDTRGFIYTLLFIGMALVSAIPIISIISIFMILGQ